MSTLPSIARKRTSSLRTYQPGAEAATRAGKLSSNEAPLGPAPNVRQAIAKAIDNVHRYPNARDLTHEVAVRAGLSDDQVILTNGSDELCYLIATLFIEPGQAVVMSDPSYQIDELVTRVQQGDPRLVPLVDGQHDLSTMAQAAQEAAIVWLPTPHNPTGVACDPLALEAFLEQTPKSCLVVLDEAYRCYVDADRRPDATRLLREHPNLVVQRTFSKAYALAGLRLGYGFGAPELIKALHAIRPPFNVNGAAIAAGHAALENPHWRDYAVELVRRERTRLEHTLTEEAYQFIPSQANFVTFRTPELARLREELLAAGLIVRDGEDLGFPGWLRASIGAPTEMASFRSILTQHRAAS